MSTTETARMAEEAAGGVRSIRIITSNSTFVSGRASSEASTATALYNTTPLRNIQTGN
jgi:hypothetical protein